MGKHNLVALLFRNILPAGLCLVVLLCLGHPILTLASPQPADTVIEASDVLQVEVQGEQALSVVRQVCESGSFPYPLLREVQAVDKTPDQLARHMEKRLYEEEFLWDPHVTVTIIERPGYAVWVHGQVGKPGRTAFQAGMRLRDTLAKHGGIRDDRAGPDIILHGRRREFPVRIDRQILFSSGPGSDLLNLRLRPGDEVIIPEAEGYIVAGAVQTPGRRLLTRRLTVSQLLSDSVTAASETDGWVVLQHKDRVDAPEVLIRLSEIRSGNKAVDRPIRSDDRITVIAAGFFYVGGLVGRPGAYKWTEGLSVGQALTDAGAPQDLSGTIVKATKWKEPEPDEIPVVSLDDFVRDKDLLFVVDRPHGE